MSAIRVRFALDFDAGAWPGPLAGREAVAGEAWLGPLGLLGHLELLTGLGGIAVHPAERVAVLATALQRTSGFWDASAEVDAAGSARELLRWRDELVLAGWDGRPDGMPPRLAALAAVTAEVPPGAPDRLRALADALGRRPGDPDLIEEIELVDSLASLPELWRRCLAALERHGAQVAQVALPVIAGRGDLESLRVASGRMAPRRDGTVQLLRSDGPWAAAEAIAGWLAALDDLDGTLVVTPSPLLDSELHRFGLPTTGATDERDGEALLEVVPLVLALGWSPPDPQHAVELLRIPDGPIPRRPAWRLLHALEEWPAVGSPAWGRAIEESLAEIDDGARRERVRRGLDGIFASSVRRTGASSYPLAELHERMETVRAWARVRRAVEPADATDPSRIQRWDRVSAFASAIERLAQLSLRESWPAAELHHLLTEARQMVAGLASHPAQSGIAAIGAPGAMAGAAKRVIWWGFDRSAGRAPAGLPFSRAEREQLAASGIELPDAATQALWLAQRWRRPLDLASDTLLLVSPLRDEAGEESHPHPVWDEVAARCEEASVASLVFSHLVPAPGDRGPATVARELAPLPRGKRRWSVPGRQVALRDRESQTSIDALLRCSLRWALRYHGGLRGRAVPDCTVSPRCLGNLGHALLEAVLPAAGNDPGRGERLAGEWFEREVERRVAALCLPGQEGERARVRRLLCAATAGLAEFLAASGLGVRGVEQGVAARALGRTLEGRLDLLLGEPPVVVDAKWGGRKRRFDALRLGTASQLAFYAHLLSQSQGPGAPAPAVAFFVLSENALLTTAPHLPRPAQRVSGPGAAETWRLLEQAFEEVRNGVESGELLALGHPDGEDERIPEKDAIDGSGRLVLAPDCRYCDYGGLCGRDLLAAGEGA